MLDVYTRGLIVPEQSIAIVSAFGIRKEHVAIRYSRILKEKYSNEEIDCLSLLEVLQLIKQHNMEAESIILWNTNKTAIQYINEYKEVSGKNLSNIIKQIHELLDGTKNINIRWIPFEKNLANLMISRVLSKNTTEYFVREDIEAFDNSQLLEKIRLLEKENLELQKEKQVYGIELTRKQVAVDKLKQQLEQNNQELNKYKAIVNRLNTERMIAFMLSLPPTPIN